MTDKGELHKDTHMGERKRPKESKKGRTKTVEKKVKRKRKWVGKERRDPCTHIHKVQERAVNKVKQEFKNKTKTTDALKI